jgi:hypothetical protein
MVIGYGSGSKVKTFGLKKFNKKTGYSPALAIKIMS